MRKSADEARKQAQKEKVESDRAWRITTVDHRNAKERHRDKFYEGLQVLPDYVPIRNSASDGDGEADGNNSENWRHQPYDGGGTGGSYGNNSENWRQQPYGESGEAAGKNQGRGAKPGKPGKGGKSEKGGNNRR